MMGPSGRHSPFHEAEEFKELADPFLDIQKTAKIALTPGEGEGGCGIDGTYASFEALLRSFLDPCA